MQELELYIPKKLAIDQLLRTLQPLRSLKLSDSDHPEVFDVLSAIPDKVKKMKVFELDVLPSITALPTILYPEWINLTHLHFEEAPVHQISWHEKRRRSGYLAEGSKQFDAKD